MDGAGGAGGGSGGRCGIRTCDPCRVNRLKVSADLHQTYQVLAITEDHEATELRTSARFGTVFRRLGPNWVQSWSSKHFAAGGSPEPLLSVREVAKRLGVSTATVYRLCEQGELPHVRVSHTIRLRSIDVAEFVEAHRTRSPPGSRVALGDRPLNL